MVRPAQGANVRAAIYCRLSRVFEPGDTGNVDDQEQRCRAVAEQRGWNVVAVFKDNSKSAWQTNRRRPDWEAMLDGLQAEAYDAIVVYHGDRLIRQPWDLERLLMLADQKGIRLTSPTGERDLDNSDDRYALRIEAAHACRESDNTSRRARRGHERLVMAGKPAAGGLRPYGYESDLVTVRQPEAEALREAARRILAGETLGSIVRDFTRRGIGTSLGGEWRPSSLRRVIMRPRSAGLRSHLDVVTGPASWPAILEEDTWRAVCAILDGRRAKVAAYSSNARRYLLSGIARCQTCGDTMKARWLHYEHRVGSYGCINPPCPLKVHCNMRHLDAHVVAETVRVLADRRVGDDLRDGKEAAGQQDRDAAAGLAAKLEQIAADYADDLITRGQMLTSTEQTRRRLAEVEARLAERQREDVLADLPIEAPEDFLALPLGTQRTIIAKVWSEIVVGPATTRGPGFERGRVKLD